MVYALKVPKEDAEKVRKKLVRDNLLDSSWKIEVVDDYVIFPLKKKIDGAEDMKLKVREGKIRPYVKVKRKLEEMGIDLDIPSKWERIGDVILLPHFDLPEKYYKIVGETYGEILGVRTVVMYLGIRGELREQRVVKIWGDGTETVHVENGIKYAIDVSKLMFSSGNIEERIRMARMDFNGKVVIDMFSGIGYFTLPAARSAGRVYACEKNLVSFYYLLKNISLNSLSNVIPLFGDNRVVCPRRAADYVIMGYFNTEIFLDYAFEILKESGGLIFYHDLVKEGHEAEMEEKIKEKARAHGFSGRVEKRRIIKSYAPRVWHMVFEFRAEKY